MATTRKSTRAKKAAAPKGARAEGAATPSAPTNPLNGDVSGAREAQIRQREADMLAMRTAGVSVQAIADHFHVDHSTVSHILSRVLKRTVAAPAAELRELELQRLDRIIRAWYEDAIGAPKPDGTTRPKSEKAAAIVLSALDRRAKLLGLEKLVIENITETPEERAARVAEQMEAYLKGVIDGAPSSTSAEAAGSSVTS